MHRPLKQALFSCFRLILATFPLCSCFGQSLRDTSLISLISRPFFYNVIKDRKGVIYAGSTEGVYRMEEATPVRVDGRKGYLMVDEKGGVVVDSNGLKYNKQTGMSHLLPYPDESKNEYHAGDDSYFYITAGGRMHVYEFRPYGYRFRNHSIRTISANFTGTYSGIYYRERLLRPPVSPFSDGYIRELNGKVFMCAHGLDVFDMKELEAGSESPRPLPLAGGFNLAPCRDIRYLASARQYLVASGNRLVTIDSSLETASVAFTGTGDSEVVMLNEDRTYAIMYFSQGNRLYVFQPDSRKVVGSTVAEQPILDGVISPQQAYLLTPEALLSIREGKTERKVEGIEKAHTLRAVSETEFVIATDRGLFLYNIPEDRLSTLVPQVEFNRRALHVEGNRLYAGSINGLYILDLANLDNIVDFHERQFPSNDRQSIPAWVIAVFAMAVGGMGLTIHRYRSRIRRMEKRLESMEAPEPSPRLERKEIETFIEANLPNASLKTIIDHFKTNNSMVYSLLAPQRPGELIQKLRQEKVRGMRMEGRKVGEIAEATGLSESYIRKIWNKEG
jgi:hypothetical protein